MASVFLAVAVLGVPLAFAVSHIVSGDQRSELERLALRAAVTVSPDYRTGDPVELPASQSDIDLGVYDAHGQRIAGSGPARLEPSLLVAASGSLAQGDVKEHLVVAVPVSTGEQVIAVVRAASPESAVTARAVRWDLGLLGACVVAALCAAGLAGWQSRRLVRPLVGLAQLSGELGDGDFSVRTSPSGVAEIDAAGAALNRTAERLADMIRRERSFSTYASHQLRTPLTQLQLELEAGLETGGEALEDAANAAMSTATRLSQTIDDVLAVARRPGDVVGFDVAELLAPLHEQWNGLLAAQDRPFRVTTADGLRVAGSLPTARQIIHVLLDNAVQHGRGMVQVRARDSHGAVAIDIVDEGTAQPIAMTGDGRLGLSLARSLADAEHGRLLLDQRGEGTRFTLLLPAGDGRPDDG